MILTNMVGEDVKLFIRDPCDVHKHVLSVGRIVAIYVGTDNGTCTRARAVVRLDDGTLTDRLMTELDAGDLDEEVEPVKPPEPVKAPDQTYVLEEYDRHCPGCHQQSVHGYCHGVGWKCGRCGRTTAESMFGPQPTPIF